ncbi:glycoside hydrolase family 43 protein [Alkalitalea saponilacus]|nr:glycoside hydrolase family 43 protein [Alkalitalea saponilacus]
MRNTGKDTYLLPVEWPSGGWAAVISYNLGGLKISIPKVSLDN